MKKWAALLILSFFCIAMLQGAACPKTGSTGAALGGDRELYMEAEKYFEAGDYEAARSLYQQVQEDYPGSSWAEKAQFRMGQCYFKMDQTEEALTEFRSYAENSKNDSQVIVAQDYIIRILENELSAQSSRFDSMLVGYEQQNFRYEMLNRYLRQSVDSEVVYIELDLEENRLFVKLGTQTLYEYPIVSGKGVRRITVKTIQVVDGDTQEDIKVRRKDFSTPKGIRQVEYIQKDPVWYKPDWAWYEAGEALPEELTMDDRAVPGVLGPYKVSIGEAYYIHGTRRGKIRPGKYSHGCVRMNNDDLRQLVKLIEEGTMVYIY